MVPTGEVTYGETSDVKNKFVVDIDTSYYYRQIAMENLTPTQHNKTKLVTHYIHLSLNIYKRWRTVEKR